jgi:hypothetical protein
MIAEEPYITNQRISSNLLEVIVHCQHTLAKDGVFLEKLLPHSNVLDNTTEGSKVHWRDEDTPEDLDH